jgi:hypothetical protein
VFHVPELARNTTHPVLGTTAANGNNGAFDVESPEPGWRLALIASDGTEAPDMANWQWEHVSVHAYRPGSPQPDGFTLASRRPAMRTPTWKEMSYVKRLCWDAEDVVMQLHPRESEYVNCHPHVLHLWRPKHQQIPTPPAELVGPTQGATA